MIESYLIENVLSAVYDYLKKRIVSSPADRLKFDFFIKGNDDSKIAIEVKGNPPSERVLKDLFNNLLPYKDINEFYLITPEEPTKSQQTRFKGIFKKYTGTVKWMGINEYLSSQNLGIVLSDNMRKSLLNLQVATLTSKFDDLLL